MQVLDKASAVVPGGNLPSGAEGPPAGSAALDQVTASNVETLAAQGNPLFSLREWLSPENVS